MNKPSTLAMILAGGRVDELGVLTHYRPKSAVPFGGFARVIDFPLTSLMQSGIELIAILSQYRSYSLINHIGNGAAWDMIGRYRGISILPPFKDYNNPHWYRGSADAVYQNMDFIRYHNPKQILILSGDHIYNMDYRKMIAYHNKNNADLTAAFTRVDIKRGHRFGIGEIYNEDPTGGPLISYEEKPQKPKSPWASLTILCFRPEVLYDMLAANQQNDTESYEFGRNIIPMMMNEKLRVHGYKFYGYWGYTRTIEEYWNTSMDLLGKKPKIDMEKWGIRTNLEHRNIRDCAPLIVGSSAVLDNSMAYNGCRIEGQVHNSILFPGVMVEKGAKVHDSVLFFNNTVRKNACLYKTVSDVNTVFGQNSQVGVMEKEIANQDITVIGWNNKIPDEMKIGSGCSIFPKINPDQWPSDSLEDGKVLK